MVFWLLGLVGVWFGMITGKRGDDYIISWIIMGIGMILFSVKKNK